MGEVNFQEKIKAKTITLRGIREGIITTPNHHPNPKFVLLDDVLDCYAEDQKEDQEIRGSLAKLCTDLNDKILLLEMAEKERKQKLQQLNKAIMKYYWELHDDYEDAKMSQAAWSTFEAFHIWLGKKFEELLK